MDSDVTHVCVNCGPKSIHAFPPSELKRKSGRCTACCTKRTPQLRGCGATPITPGYEFNSYKRAKPGAR